MENFNQRPYKGLRAEYGDRLVYAVSVWRTKAETVQDSGISSSRRKWTSPAPLPAPEQIVAVRVSALEATIRQQVRH